MPSSVSTVLIALAFFVGHSAGLVLLLIALAIEVGLFIFAGINT